MRAFAGCLLGLMLCGTAHGAVLTLGSGSFGASSCTPVCDGTFSAGPEVGTIDDFYKFSVTDGVLLQTASATNSSAVPGEEISSFSIKLFDGTPPGNSPPLSTGAGAEFDATSQTTGNLPDTPLSPGNYFLEIAGTDGGTPTTYGGSFSFAPVSQTPIPGALWLFGTALAGLFWKTRKA